MKAAVYQGSQQFDVTEIDTPEPGSGQLLVEVLYKFSGSGLSLLARTWPWEEIVGVAFRFAAHDIVILVMLPVLIWILVSFRRADWVSWVQTDAQPVVKQKVSTPDSAQRAISLRRRR